MDEKFIERVLSLIEQVPPGRAVSYGQLADYLGRGGARNIGQIMSVYGSAVPWWRVVRTDGSMAPHLMLEAQQHWRDESMPVYRGRVDMREAEFRIGESVSDPSAEIVP